VVIIDIIDYRLLLAAVYFYAHPGEVDQLAGLSTEMVDSVSSLQEKYNLILSHYLAQAISIGRAAELLGLSAFDLRIRCLRLNIPLRLAPESVAEALADGEEAIASADSKF
jgi:predicted HTH domain antitoxin